MTKEKITHDAASNKSEAGRLTLGVPEYRTESAVYDSRSLGRLLFPLGRGHDGHDARSRAPTVLCYRHARLMPGQAGGS